MHPDDPVLFRSLFEAAPDAMVVVRPDGRIVLANEQAHRLFGYARGVLEGLCVEALLPVAQREVHESLRAGYARAPRLRPMGAGRELTAIRADGSAFPVEIGLSPVASQEAPLFAASVRDISETQRARRALARVRYDVALADMGRLLVAAAGPDMALGDVARNVRDALGASAAGILLQVRGGKGFRMASVAGVLPDALADAKNAVWLERLPTAARSALAAGEPAHMHEFGNETLMCVALGGDADTLGYLVALLPGQGQPDSDQAHFLRSAGHLASAAIRRAQSEERLSHAQRLDALGQLTGGIAHDFNNLLTIVSGNLQLLSLEDMDATSMREAVASAARAVERGAALTRKLLGFSRRQPLRPRAIRPEVLLADLVDMLVRTLGEAIEVRADCPEGLPSVYADAGELEAALLNLALNARDAMPSGGNLTLGVHLESVGTPRMANVVFTVADTGAGMPPDILARAMEPFFTTKSADKGSGLGLSMVYGFARQSHGRLQIESVPGQGTQVQLALPAARRETPAAPAPRASRDSGGGTVLVVEDEAELRQIACRYLGTQGFATLQAADATTALAVIADRPDIMAVFSDVVLAGGQSGVDLAQRIRKVRPSLPILLTSGYDQGQGSAAGGFDWLAKPYQLDELGARLAALLTTRRTHHG
ncbi:His Kinase A (phospho-acceptor) domain-containing protein [Luteibacter sp. UNCMF331Sha3.1]|uniref:PAS domain S-box protein n=1 Tax=Luteibacter sp. UNCMF331Sha3.1 TaxID=1502760 RepID=UPI0008C261DD|nr:PAS domain S-box protein [Luteibacter sp. UNCMF331Sha3.1]SEN19307.1 His Kinase A (phospho-acceptor) domain-containing protein [Luteibacter sp. UNCMF331Sha3.1]